MAKSINKQWTHEEVCQLIQAYESNPILWEVKHRDYRHKTKKNLVLESFATDFNCPVSEIWRKLHNLRSQFSQELKKINKKRESRTEGTTGWPYFSALSFIVPNLQAPATQSNLRPRSSNSGEDNVFSKNTDDDNETNWNSPPNKKTKTQKFEIADSDSAIKTVIQLLNKPTDECDKFGEYVASELRSLKLDFVRRRLKTDIRKAILNAVEEEDTHFLQNSSGCSSAPIPEAHVVISIAGNSES